MKCVFLPAIVLFALSVSVSIQAEEKFSPEQLSFFERKIRPVLVQHCYECHAEDSDPIEGGLRVDLREGLLQGGETGPSVVPGNPADSLLLTAMEFRDGLEMPPESQLPEDVIRDFRRWIKMGAPDPREGSMSPPRPDVAGRQSEDDLWSLRPVSNPDVPDIVEDGARGQDMSNIDRFLGAAMAERGLTPVGSARPAALIRRVSFDLTGLPPDPVDVEDFLANPTEESYRNYVDRLLASPQFGERWARHWFDIARYAESAGNSRDVLMTTAWRYRDYVIDAMNADVPYDRFLAEQIAGDLLEAETDDERRRLLIATGFLAIGSKSLNGGNITLDLVDDQIDVIGKSMLGLTVSCARCHDHKFDPIPTADYYALAGIFKSTETWYGGGTNRPKTTGEMAKAYLPLADATLVKKIDDHETRLNDLNGKRTKAAKQVRALLDKLPKDWMVREQALKAKSADTGEEPQLSPEEQTFQKQLTAYRDAQNQHRTLIKEIEVLEEEKFPELEFAIGVQEAKKVQDSPIHVRGEPKKTGDIVPRGFLTCFSIENAPVISPSESGRRQLAEWLGHSQNPLTPRVAVNRWWSHLFGKGLVETVDNFGMTAPSPSHPELLDHLAFRLVHVHNWSRKAIIREIVLTDAYRRSSESATDPVAKDEANVWYWRHDRKRLSAEAIRDAMLFASGDLVLERPQGSLVAEMGEGEVGRGINTQILERPYPYRGVYLPIIRGILPELLKIFDFPEPSNPQGTRMTTNVPAQSLFLMNSPFVLNQSRIFANRLRQIEGTDADRIQKAYLLTYGRLPHLDEQRSALIFVSQFENGLANSSRPPENISEAAWSSLCQSLFASAEFRYLD